MKNECKAAEVPSLQRAKMNKSEAAAGVEKERCVLPAVILIQRLREGRCCVLLKLLELLYKP